MKKIFIVLAFIFVGMASAMQQRSLLDGNDMRKYVHTDPEEIAYLKGIEDLYKRIQQRKSHTQQAVQSEGPTGGPNLEQIFSFLKPVQNHNVSHAKPLILGFCSVGNADEQQDRAIAIHQQEKPEKMQLSFLLQPEEKSNPKKRTFEEAASSDEKKRDLFNESVVSDVDNVASQGPILSENREICGINSCKFHADKRGIMSIHKKRRHTQKQCYWPGCALLCQSRGELLQHINRCHLEKHCIVCGYASEKRGDLLRHFRRAKHGYILKDPPFINFKLG